jgi:hypothetical protein
VESGRLLFANGYKGCLCGAGRFPSPGRVFVTLRKHRHGGPDDASPSSRPRPSAHLESTVSETRRSSPPPARGARADSGVRTRTECALIVAEEDRARGILADRLIAAGFFVEWASNAEEARRKASRCKPDVVVVEHLPNGPLMDDVVRSVVMTDATRHSLVVVTIDRAPGVSAARRLVTLLFRNDAQHTIDTLIRAIVPSRAVG